MSLAKVSIITLTLISLLVAPSLVELVGNDGSYTSSELTSWTNSNQDNFDAINGGLPNYSQDYDFRSFSPDLSQIANDFVESLNNLGNTAYELYDAISTFFNDPFNLDEDVPEPFNYITNANRILTTIANAQTWWDSLNATEQVMYEVNLYPKIFFAVKWMYYSPAELNA
jgi:hypothetical protein